MPESDADAPGDDRIVYRLKEPNTRAATAPAKQRVNPLPNPMNDADILAGLQKYGELHLLLESGANAHVHLHDTTVQKGVVAIDSKAGEWCFGVERIESVEYPVSELHPPE